MRFHVFLNFSLRNTFCGGSTQLLGVVFHGGANGVGHWGGFRKRWGVFRLFRRFKSKFGTKFQHFFTNSSSGVTDTQLGHIPRERA